MYSRLIRAERPVSPSHRIVARKISLKSSDDIQPPTEKYLMESSSEEAFRNTLLCEIVRAISSDGICIPSSNLISKEFTEDDDEEKLKVPPFSKPGITSSPKLPYEEEYLKVKRAQMILIKTFELLKRSMYTPGIEDKSLTEIKKTGAILMRMLSQKRVFDKMRLLITSIAQNFTMQFLSEKEAELSRRKNVKMHTSFPGKFIMKDSEESRRYKALLFVLYLLISRTKQLAWAKSIPTLGGKESTEDDEEKSKVPPFFEPGITSTPKVPNEEGDNELKKRKRKRKVPKPGTSPKVPDKQKRLKVAKPDDRCFFSDLTEEQLMPLFCNARKFRFVPCKVYLSYSNDDAITSTREVYCQRRSKYYTYDLPKDTAHVKVGSVHQLFGSIQAAGFSLDPGSPSFSIFNHKFNDPIVVPQLGSLSPHCFRYCSVPFSTSVKIAAKLYVTTDKLDDMMDSHDYWDYYIDKDPNEQLNDAFEVCNDCALINLSDNFTKRPNGGSGSYTLKGRDGHLKLYYVAFKYAVDAALEVVFAAASEETKVAGRVMAYYGKNFNYGCSPAEEDDYKAMLFETEQHEVKPGKINLMRSVLSVPAQFSLIIDANLTDSNSGDIILSGVYEFLVPTDGSASVGCIKGNDCSLKLKVDWKLPPFAEETTPAKRSYYSYLTKQQVLSRSIYAPVTMDEENTLREEYYRWNLQEKISTAFSYFLHSVLHCEKGAASISISTGTKADECDYICTSVLNIWPERSHANFEGPKRLGLFERVGLLCIPKARMMEKCVVGGPGFLKFKLSGAWIAKSVRKMLMYGIDIWAPNLPMKKAVIDFLSRNTAKGMCMDHLRSTIIGETLARMLEYSRVAVERRFHFGGHLDINSKIMMTEFLFDRFPNGEINYQAIGELEVLFEESKKRFDEDAEFRERTQQAQGLDDRHKFAWAQICNISRERYQKVYQRLGVYVKEEDGELPDTDISKPKSLLRKHGLTIESEGDEAVIFEGRKLPLVDLAALWVALEIKKADRIVHVADVGQRDKIEMCINAAKSAELIVSDDVHDPLSHVGFGLVQGKDLEGFRTSSKVLNLVSLLDEAKSRCKAVLVGQGKADKDLEHTAEALGYGAVKYADLKNDRLTNYTFSFDDMLNEKGNTAAYLQYTYARIWRVMQTSNKHIEKLEVETLSLKDGEERELGLHLLRFTEVLGKACRVLAPHIMCEYVYVLCKKFNKLYSSSWQVVQPGEDSKLLLCEATKVVMRKCFYFLGITPIYKI